jgi:hypothetical protein
MALEQLTEISGVVGDDLEILTAVWCNTHFGVKTGGFNGDSI